MCKSEGDQKEGREAHEPGCGGVGCTLNIDLVVELRNSEGMVTSKAYKIGQALFLLHLCSQNHLSLLLSFKEGVSEQLGGARGNHGVTNSALIFTLLPGSSQGKSIVPLDQMFKDAMPVLDPMYALEMDGRRLSDIQLSKYHYALHLLCKDFQQEQRWAR
eukprot:scaffold68_cov340-Pavlova_lutheri.AAC.50